MNKILVVYITVFLCCTILPLAAQEVEKTKTYWMSASEFIFSGSQVEATGGPLNREMDINPIVRFTCFFHFQEQYHVDFGKNFGIYTGIGLRNVGMINELNDSVKAKQRVYSLGVPLALKIGKLPGGFHINLGGEAELFFHYKQKVFYDEEKFKKSEWFSKKVNLVNPSAFIDIHSGKGAYLRLKYYLLDFLVQDKQDIKLHGIPFEYRPETSQLFYVSIGTTIKSMPSRKLKKKKTP